MTATAPAYKVRAVTCDYQASQEEIDAAVRRMCMPLERSWEKLRKAKRIGIKFNQDWPQYRLKTYQGHLQQLASVQVMKSVLRLLREETSADLVCVDIGIESYRDKLADHSGTNAMPALQQYDVPFIELCDHPTEWIDVPGGGLMFDRYPISSEMLKVDAVVDVQKIKTHNFMGITFGLKNLFGLMPFLSGGRPRMYYHHLVRMPYMLADLGRIYQPALTILDGLVTQSGGEWGPGDQPRIANTLVAGDHVVSTDACVAHLVGFDPAGEWLTPPYFRDRNALKVAADSDFGTVNLAEIDFASEVKAPITNIMPNITDSQEMVVSWLRSMSEQGLYYRDNRARLIREYAEKYILLQMNEVKWSSEDGQFRGSRREISGAHPEQAMFFKYVDPEEDEGEHFEVYEYTLQMIKEKVG